MDNLRVNTVNVVDNVSIKVVFTAPLNTDISVSNVSIISETLGVPDPGVLQVKVSGNTLTLSVQPLTSFASYILIFTSTETIPFQSLNGTALLLEDGIANKQSFLGPVENTNLIKDYILSYLRDQVYNTESGTLIHDYIDTLSTVISTALYAVRQARNENYLSVTITDEPKTRGETAFDRLEQEGAYEVLRVGRNATDAETPLTLSFDDFSSDPVSLLAKSFSESLTIDSSDLVAGTININDLILNLSKRFVTIVSSVIFTYSNGHSPYVYDLSSLGYQILDPRYDSSHAFKYLLLSDNQIRLSDKILEDPTFSLNSIFQVQVSYEYKDTGRSLNPSSVAVSSVLSSGREVLPPLRNVFNLKHGPITTANNKIGSLGDITFVDQNTLSILNQPHPAFQTEIPFRFNAIPSSPGIYAVDYETGTIYVFGEDAHNAGTGATPPLAIYSYQLNYKEDVDFTVDDDTSDLVALPNGSLINGSGQVSFNYEQVLAADIDYKAHIHQEVLDERIGNNLVALNALTVDQAPITNVFRIFNETSGEIYPVVRWNNNTVFFTYNTPPKIEEILGERASFEEINNEVLFVSSVLDTASPSVKIFKVVLDNDNIIAQSEDCLGASFNTTLSPSDTAIFGAEVYYDKVETITLNLLRLDTIGKYFCDYKNGVIYVCVSAAQDYNIGSASYKRGYIILQNPHITSVEDIFYRINTLSAKDKHFTYTDFDDTFVLPTGFDEADEQFLNDDTTEPYLLSSNEVGAFVDGYFSNTVSDNIQFIRAIYENTDLLNNSKPLNFSEATTFVNKSITLSPIERQEYHSVEVDGDGYFVLLNTPLLYLSANITPDFSVIRLSDGYDLWDNSGTLVLGNLLRLTLSGTNTPEAGDSVLVSYSYTINDLSHLIVDYNKGEYYIDYTALTDEVIISYEYGDNSLDFRESLALNAGDDYFVTYKAGSLRDALLKNFGSLIDISLLNVFDVTYPRERYRDALVAAMHSFSLGPTPTAIKNIAQTISHLPANLEESIFEGWDLGSALLNPHEYETTGDLEMQPTKYGNGVIIEEPTQTLTLPAISNIKLEEGTFEAWVSPHWDGLDNIADLEITPFKDGYLASPLEVFIGAQEYHPTYETGKQFFSLDKSQQVDGIPNRNKDGIYIYYAKDPSSSFNRWFVEIIDGYANDGYSIDGYAVKDYSISITTNGRFYDVKSLSNPKPGSSTITSGTNTLNFKVHSGFPNEGITFIADIPHYLLDYAEEENKNRISLFKDESGYLNFRVFDKLKTPYTVSTDVSVWRHGELHHIAASWKLNTVIGRDELHLFIDGFEVPNIIRYGDRIKPYLHEKFRTVNPEEVVGVVLANIIGNNDLNTVFTSTQVISSANFSAYGINIGDTLYVEEPGFDPNGYSITNVNGNTLTLASPMPATISDGAYSINKISFDVSTEIDVFPNFTISLLHSYADGYDLHTTFNTMSVSSAGTNFLTKGTLPGDLIRIDDGYFEKHYIILAVSAHNLVLNDEMPVSATGLTFHLYHNDEEEEIPGLRAIHPSYELSKSTDGYFTNIITLKNNALVNDLIHLRTLGINHRRVRRSYYVWSNQTNILKTHLPQPISLDQVSINKVLLGRTLIGPANSILSAGIFTAANIPVDQPASSAGGRTLSANLQGDNIDFSVSPTIQINGTTVDSAGILHPGTSELLTFNEPGIQSTIHLFAQVNYITVIVKPINSARSAGFVELKEKYSLTQGENLGIFVGPVPEAVIRYSYQVSVGNTLSSDGYVFSDGYTVSDENNFFSSNVVGSYLAISNPVSDAGFYQIASISDDHKTLYLAPNDHLLSVFTDGYYEILNPSDYRSGLQNGFFTFEHKLLPGEPYYLTQGLYELDYYTYLIAPFELKSENLFIGSDFNGLNQFKGSIDELQILNTKLTDTRIGETAAATQRTITKEFNSLKASKADKTSLVLTHFDTFPILNEADIYLSADKDILQAGTVINDNFGQSIQFIDKPLILDNDGILDTRKEATIEFWMNPIFDTYNDPNYRFYFDAYGNVIENLISDNNTTITLLGAASQVLSVKILGSDTDYFANGSLSNGGKTLLLHKALPNQNMPVIVDYLPKGLQGDRISIYKDPAGYLNFNIRANQIDYQVRAPILFARNTWHRIKASYKVNSGKISDEMHLFIDGYERANVLYGTSLLFGQGVVYGSTFSGPNTRKFNIKFQDSINELYIGSDTSSGNKAHILMDNLRISDISRPLYQPFGEPLDANYNSNLSMVFPMTEDLYTTYLLNFDSLVIKNLDFADLNSRDSAGSFFSLDVLDSFGIMASGGVKVKEVLESLIKNFKPAQTQALIRYL